jgi:hypothetical protein
MATTHRRFQFEQTEDQLMRDRIPNEVGLARYAELAKGQTLSDDQVC